MPVSKLKITGYILLGLISIIGALLLYYVIYYAIQLKYGNAETINTLTRSLEGTFTQASSASAPVSRPDWQSYIRTENPSVGSIDAPVTIVMFIDFECPYCQASFPIFKEMTEIYGGALRVVMKQFPIESIHPHALPAARASTCAEEQGVFWEFYDRAFIGKNLDESALYTYATASGVEGITFDQCVKTKKYDRLINQDLSDGVDLGVRGTPTYIVNGKFVEGVQTLEQWKNIILNELN